jgi:hypothetical protein
MTERPQQTQRADGPRILPWVLKPFLRYIDWSMKRQFHAVRVDSCGLPPVLDPGTPAVVYLNHASWWDPLLMMWLGANAYPGRDQYGPIEAGQLQRYGFFKHLGVFGVEKGTASGARVFLRTAQRVLSRPGAMLWLTPQGRFADVRERPARFAPGLAHLAARLPEAVYVPLAVEYGFGEERLPEIFLKFGGGLSGAALGRGADGAQDVLQGALEECQEALRERVCRRTPEGFRVLLDGAGGASVPYDLWRRFKAAFRGERAELNHSMQ